MTKLKNSAERVANLLEKFPGTAQVMVDIMTYCNHEYIVVSQKVNETSVHATQFMCNKCTHLIGMATATKLNEDVTGLLNKNVIPGGSQTADDS